MGQGNVVLLNGTSSAGKSTIARALQEIMETPYLHMGIDHFLSSVPPTGALVTDVDGQVTTDFFQVVYQGRTTESIAAVQRGEADYPDGVLAEVRIGPGGLKLLAGMYRSIAALAAAGIDVIVDDVIHDRRVLMAAVEALRDAPVLFVGLRLPREVAERRERERGDRGPGGAAAFYDLVHAHGVYDLELDTAAASPMECALRIKQALQDGHPRRAFRELAAAFAG
jgi:chloramphenicol 3-O phosphotransferase